MAIRRGPFQVLEASSLRSSPWGRRGPFSAWRLPPSPDAVVAAPAPAARPQAAEASAKAISPPRCARGRLTRGLLTAATDIGQGHRPCCGPGGRSSCSVHAGGWGSWGPPYLSFCPPQAENPGRAEGRRPPTTKSRPSVLPGGRFHTPPRPRASSRRVPPHGGEDTRDGHGGHRAPSASQGRRRRNRTPHHLHVDVSNVLGQFGSLAADPRKRRGSEHPKFTARPARGRSEGHDGPRTGADAWAEPAPLWGAPPFPGPSLCHRRASRPTLLLPSPSALPP